MKISYDCVNHRPYFRHITTDMLKKVDFKTRELEEVVQTHFRVLGLIPSPLNWLMFDKGLPR